MKTKYILDEADIKSAVAAWLTLQSGKNVKPDTVDVLVSQNYDDRAGGVTGYTVKVEASV